MVGVLYKISGRINNTAGSPNRNEGFDRLNGKASQPPSGWDSAGLFRIPNKFPDKGLSSKRIS